MSFQTNPRRRRRRSYRRRNPSVFGSGYRRNPTFFGIDVEKTGGAAVGAVGTAYLDSALVGPFLGPMLTMAGTWKPAAQALISTIGAHWLTQRFARRYSSLVTPGANLYGLLGVVNTAAPGLVPITIGVPKQLQGLRLFAALQPPSTTPAAAAPASAALPAGATTGSGTMSQTGGRRIQAPNGM